MSLVTCKTTGLRPEFAPTPTRGGRTPNRPAAQSLTRQLFAFAGALVLTAMVPALAGAAELRVVEFTSAGCAVCQQMQPVMEQFLAKGYPITQVDVDQQPDLANRFQIKNLPTFIVLRDNQEIGRREGALPVDEILALFQPPSLRQPPTLDDVTSATQGALPNQAPVAGGTSAEPLAAAPLAAAPLAAAPRLNAHTSSPTSLPVAAPEVAPASLAAPAATKTQATQQQATQQQAPQQLALQASVRIRVEDAEGVSYGSGTVIDVHGAEALVVTCGHVFRDSQGKGRILIDTSDGSQVGVPGHLVSYDLNNDVGLISFHSNRPIQPVVVGGTQHRLQPGQPVFSIGCDKGDPPSIRQGQVVALNKYLGAANITVTGLPVDGRSGGGLFDAQGVLVGICNCADPQANEGLYAALPSVHAELDRSKLSFVYRRPAQGAPSSAALAQGTSSTPLSSIPAAAAEARPTAHLSATPLSATPLSAATQEAAEDVELILIVRSKQNPHTDSKMFVVAEPSSDMLEQVQREVVRQTSARTTSWQQQR